MSFHPFLRRGAFTLRAGAVSLFRRLRSVRRGGSGVRRALFRFNGARAPAFARAVLLRVVLHAVDSQRALGEAVHLVVSLGDLFGDVVRYVFDIGQQIVLFRILDHAVEEPVEALYIRLDVALGDVALDKSRPQFREKILFVCQGLSQPPVICKKFRNIFE